MQSQSSIVKLQIITLAAKLVICDPDHHPVVALCTYVLDMARYDQDYDVRDRARLLSSMLQGTVTSLQTADLLDESSSRGQGSVILRREQIKRVLFEGKALSSPQHSSM